MDSLPAPGGSLGVTFSNIRCCGARCPSSALQLGGNPAGGSAGTWHLSGSSTALGVTRHGAGAGLGALALLLGSGRAPSRCSPMSSSASLTVSFNMASWPENNHLGHLANVYGFFIAGFSARRGSAPGAQSRAARGSGRTEPWHRHSHLRPRWPWPGTVSPVSWVSHPDLSGFPGTVWPGQCRQPCVPTGLEEDAGSGAAPHRVTSGSE